MGRMDKKTGFKECSRCGLRNKPTAKQCDFCGQRFEVNDDWEQQIDALEKLSKNSRKVEVSEDLSKKIEATIVTKEMAESKEKELSRPAEPVIVSRPPLPEPECVTPKPLPPVQAPPPAPKQEPVYVAPKPSPVVKQVEPPAPVQEIGPEPVIEESCAVESEPEPAPVETIKVTKRMEKRKPKTVPSSRFFRWGLDMKDRASFVFVALMVIGIIAYIVSLVMAGSLGSMVSWGFVVVSGLLIVMGFSQVGINWDVAEEPVHVDIPGTADDEIVEICPSCHERVSPDLDRCPACGTEFEPSEEQ